MCRWSVCQSIGAWFHANAVLYGIVGIAVLLTLFRLATRGRWLTLFLVLGIWAIVASIILLVPGNSTTSL
jgi:hypothetical protein